MGKNDISSFQNLPSKKIVETEMKSKKYKTKAPQRMGRPLKPIEEKESFRIAFSLTQKEADIIIGKSGRLSPNIFIKNYLRDNTDLLDL